MVSENASTFKTFMIDHSIEVAHLGFGSMRLTGRGIWGEPADRGEANRTLKRLPALGVNFIDTADSYGPNIAEDLIHEALHPYSGILIATEAGLARTGPDQWVPLGRPECLIHQAHASRRRLGVEQIGRWQLHRIDPKTPCDEQFGVIIKHLLDDGVIGHAGLSQVSVADIKAASKVFKAARSVRDWWASAQRVYPVNSRRPWRADWHDYAAFCEGQGVATVPATPATVAAFVGACGEAGKKAAAARKGVEVKDNSGTDRRAAQPRRGGEHLQGRARSRSRPSVGSHLCSVGRRPAERRHGLIAA